MPPIVRRLLIALLVSLPLGGLAESDAGPEAGRTESSPHSSPSVLLVTFDTTRADALGVHGRDPSPTPHLDALAAEGVRFAKTVSPSPVTVPSHASMMTGLAPRQHGIRDNAPFVLADRHVTLAERLREAGYDTAAVIGAAVLDRATGLDQGFDVYDDRVRIGPRRWFDWRERAASQVADAARARLAELEPPFFLWVHLYDPHLPYVPPDPHAGRFPDDPYLGEVAFADHAFGEILRAARARAESLVVAAASDHGESLGEHGERGHGVFIYQATQHVFWIVSGPGMPSARVVQPRVGLVDVAPTLLALAGLAAPEDVPGRDVSSLWNDERGDDPPVRAFELESFHPAYAYGWAPLTALVRGRFKLVHAPQPELYDLDSDPSEARNLIGARAEVAATLKAQLDRRFAGDSELERLEAGAALAEIDAGRLAALRSLGYVVGGRTRPGERRPDPKEAIGWLEELRAARRALTRPDEPDATGRAVAADLRRLLERNPGNHEARRLLGSAWLTAGEPSKAITVLEEAVSRSPRDDAAWTQLGLARLRASQARRPDRIQAAEAAFRRALELRPRNAEAARALANLLVDRGEPGPARDVLRSMAHREALDPALATLLGKLEAQLGRPTAARAAFQAALKLAPEHVPALRSLGKLAHGQGRFAEAERHYARALEIAPSARTARTLGSIRLLQLDDRAGAIRAFRQSLSLDPAGPEAARVRALLGELASEQPDGREHP